MQPQQSTTLTPCARSSASNAGLSRRHDTPIGFSLHPYVQPHSTPSASRRSAVRISPYVSTRIPRRLDLRTTAIGLNQAML